jgi:MFS family permease
LTAAGGAGFGTLFVFHQPYALELGMREVSSFFVAYAGAALVMRLGFLSRLELMGRQTLSGFAMTLYAVAVASAAYLKPGMLLPLGAITGLAHGVLYPVFNALAVEGVEREKRGSMMALYHGGFNAGMAVMLVSGGAIAQRFGFPALFLSVGALTLLGALTMFRVDLSHAAEAGAAVVVEPA